MARDVLAVSVTLRADRCGKRGRTRKVSIALRGASTLVIAARMARAAPTISATEGPRTASAVRNAAIRISLTLPFIIAANAEAASAAASRSPDAARFRMAPNSSCASLMKRVCETCARA